MPRKNKPHTSRLLERVKAAQPKAVLARVTPEQRKALEEIAEWAAATRKAGGAVPRTSDMHRILVEETGLKLSLSVFRSWFHNASKK